LPDDDSDANFPPGDSSSPRQDRIGSVIARLKPAGGAKKGAQLPRGLIPVALAAATVIPVAAGRPESALPKLQGTVGPDFSIHLKHGRRPVKTLRAGPYLIMVADRSPIHDFHLRGPGVNKVITSVAFVGTKTIKVQLEPGLYTYVCDPHHLLMHGSFRVR
jgi:hypothetical protein